jgi:hypothetical protein
VPLTFSCQRTITLAGNPRGFRRGGIWYLFHGIWFLSCVITCSDFYPLSNQINIFMVINIWGIIIQFSWYFLPPPIIIQFSCYVLPPPIIIQFNCYVLPPPIIMQFRCYFLPPPIIIQFSCYVLPPPIIIQFSCYFLPPPIIIQFSCYFLTSSVFETNVRKSPHIS